MNIDCRLEEHSVRGRGFGRSTRLPQPGNFKVPFCDQNSGESWTTLLGLLMLGHRHCNHNPRLLGFDHDVADGRIEYCIL